jgi:hypothetical protein
MGLSYRPIRLPPSTMLDAARDRLVTAMGHGHLHPAVFGAASDDEIADELLGQLGQASAREASPTWQRVNKNTKRLWRRLVKPATSKAARGPLGGVQQRLLDTATEAVRKAINAPSYLSDERIYERKRAQMLDRVEQTRRLAERVAA